MPSDTMRSSSPQSASVTSDLGAFARSDLRKESTPSVTFAEKVPPALAGTFVVTVEARGKNGNAIGNCDGSPEVQLRGAVGSLCRRHVDS